MGKSRRLTVSEERLRKEIVKAPVERIFHPGLGWIDVIDTKAARKRANVSKRTNIGTVYS